MAEKKLGTTQECLLDLSAGVTEGTMNFSDIHVAFPRNSLRTIKRWMGGEFFPKGENLICLRFGLAELGYQVKEVEELSNDLRTIGRAYAKEEVEFKDLCSKLGIDNDRLFNYLMGRHSPGNEMACKISELAQEIIGHGSVCDKADSSHDGNEAVIKSFIGLILAAKPLAQSILSDSFAPEERRKMREMIGRKEFFEFSLLIDGLSSEDSRKSVLKQEKLK